MFISEISIVAVLISLLAINHNSAIKDNFTEQLPEKTVNEQNFRTNAIVKLEQTDKDKHHDLVENTTLRNDTFIGIFGKNNSREGRSKKIIVLPEARHGMPMGSGGGSGKPRLSFPKVYFTAGVATQTKVASGGGGDSKQSGGNGGWGSSGGQRQQSSGGGSSGGWQIVQMPQTQQSGGGGWGGGSQGGSQGGGGGGWGGGAQGGGGQSSGGGGWGMQSGGGGGGGGGGWGMQQQSAQGGGGWGQPAQQSMGWQMSGGGGGGGGGWGMKQSKGWGEEESSECESKKSKKKKKKKEKKKKKKEKKKKKKKKSSSESGGGGWGWSRTGNDDWMVGKSRLDDNMYDDDGDEEQESVEIYHLVPISKGSRTNSPISSLQPVSYYPFSPFNFVNNYPQPNMPFSLTSISETTENNPEFVKQGMISPSGIQRIGMSSTSSHESSSSQSDESQSINTNNIGLENPITVMECTDPTLCALWKI